MIDREIKYSRETRDFDCYVDGRYIGSRANYHDADVLCDQVCYDLLADGQALTAAELDGGAEPEPDDAPGKDCDEHGPYADEDCPKCGARRMPEGDYLTPDGLRISKHNNTNNLVTAA